MIRKLLVLTVLLAIVGVTGVGAVAWAIWHYGQGLPDSSQLADYRPPVTTRVHAGDGRLIAEFATERRVFVPYDAMPKQVIQAFVAAEDQNFFQHQGVDWVAIVRAQVQNLRNLGKDRRPIGASTITQQVARIFFLSNEVSYERKIREAILAYRLEKAVGKERVLELYMNEIYLGNRAYGVAAAAINYFDRALDELTLAEAAFLASLPKAPDRYFRERFRDAAVARRNYVLGRMQEDGHIDAATAQAAMAEPIVFRDRTREERVAAAYFVEEVRRELAAVYGEDALYEGGLSVRTTLDTEMQAIATRTLRNGLIAFDRRKGYRGPVARLDSFDGWKDRLAAIAVPAGGEDWQLAVVLELDEAEARIGVAGGDRGRIAVDALTWARRSDGERFVGPPVKTPADVLAVGDVVLVERLAPRDDAFGLRQVPEVQGALVAMDPHTGRVLAMSGGFSSRISVFNRATQALRQPGSAFKPFVYLAAFNAGFTPSSLVLDAPFALDQGGGLGKWRPSNFSDRFYGPTPVRVGMEKSRNVMTVRMAQYIGMEPIVEVARNFGVTENLPPQLSMALGAGETTVLRLTAGYAMLVNGGKRIVPTFIDRVQDRTGRTVFRHDQRACDGCRDVAWPQVATADPAVPADAGLAPVSPPDALPVPDVPDTRAQIADPRTVHQVVSLLEGVVQRGTGVRIREIGKPIAGKTGTTNDANDAWFVGFSPDLAVGVFVGYDQPRSLGDRESGSSIAVPIFKDFMAAALADKPATPFRVPPGLRQVRVDPETGRLAPPGARRAIWEAFIPGTEPKGTEGVLDGGEAGTVWLPAGQEDTRKPAAIGTGTGTVY